MPERQGARQHAGVRRHAPAYARNRDLRRLIGPPPVPADSPVPPDYSLRLLRRLLRQWRGGCAAPLPSARHRALAARIAFRGELLAIRRALTQH